ncbi:hypothetical protein [Cohnella sp.]|uniref:hypothetical protein n=1 Tax=Cohnella sp. TaxID=1883426 RepID=UPI00356273C3
MSPSPWLSIVLLGVAITGYAWMIPKASGKSKETEFVSEAAYDRLLEDLETENRELVDAVAKFKREQDETVEKLGRRIVDMEQQMIKWLEQAPASATSSRSETLDLETSETTSSEKIITETAAASSIIHTPSSDPVMHEDIAIPPPTIRSRYSELLELHDKGRSVEQIAKAMGMNKGEVQLILQLVRREEQQHA